MPTLSASLVRSWVVAAPLAFAALPAASAGAAVPAQEPQPAQAMAPVRYAVFFRPATAGHGAFPWWMAAGRTRWRT